MSLSCFLAENARRVEPDFAMVSERFLDDAGKAVVWELRCISSEEDEALRRSCLKQRDGKSEPEQYRYLGLLAAACVHYPNLHDAELQNSYHVMGHDTLLKAMLTPGEYAGLLKRVQKLCGYGQSFENLVDEAKN